MKLSSKTTVNTVANAVELSTAIVHKLMGNEIANTLGGSLMTKAALASAMALRIQTHFTKKV